MPDLTTIAAPKGHSDDYLFLKDADTGRAFKAKHVLRTTAGAQPAITVSLSPVGVDGKALRNAADEPDIATLTHTFTATELADPAFDEEARISEILHRLAADKQNELAARDRVLALGEKWQHRRIDLAARIPTIEVHGEPT